MFDVHYCGLYIGPILFHCSAHLGMLGQELLQQMPEVGQVLLQLESTCSSSGFLFYICKIRWKICFVELDDFLLTSPSTAIDLIKMSPTDEVDMLLLYSRKLLYRTPCLHFSIGRNFCHLHSRKYVGTNNGSDVTVA